METLKNSGHVDECFLQKRLSLNADLHHATSQELRYLRQRCKNLWLKNGDENTSFFHKVCSARSRWSFISELVSANGLSLVSDMQIEREVIKYFSNIYKDNNSASRMVSNLDWNPISKEESDSLIRPFSEEEVLQNLKSMGRNKSPSPDGFTVEFFKKA